MNELDPSHARKVGQKRRKRLLLLVIVPFCVWAGFTWYDQEAVLAEKRRDLQKVSQSLNQAQLENEELTRQVNRLHDIDYIAEIARRDYHLSKPGEVIFITPE